MKVCPNCKEKANDDAHVCIYCGWDFYAGKVREIRRDLALGRIRNRYEYKLVRIPCDYYGELPIERAEGELNSLTKYGWRLHSVLTELSKIEEVYEYVKEEDRPYKGNGEEVARNFIPNRNVVFVMERLLKQVESHKDIQ